MSRHGCEEQISQVRRSNETVLTDQVYLPVPNKSVGVEDGMKDRFEDNDSADPTVEKIEGTKRQSGDL